MNTQNKREVIPAKSAGFCFGVKRAVETVYDEINKNCKNDKVYTLGPIIHNEQVVKELEEKGVVTIRSVSELKNYERGRLIIRSHGIDEKTYIEAKKLGFEIVDATCPFVKKIHRIVNEESKRNRQIIIIGDENHPEVQGIIGWCVNQPYVADSIKKLENIPFTLENEVVVVSQTTFNSNKFKELVEFLRKKIYNVIVYETICNATSVRQAEAKSIASAVDTMIVIGGRNSSNTQKLFEICNKQCRNTYYIETLVDLDLAAIESAERVGITAGASTPNYIIKEVHDACQN